MSDSDDDSVFSSSSASSNDEDVAVTRKRERQSYRPKQYRSKGVLSKVQGQRFFEKFRPP